MKNEKTPVTHGQPANRQGKKMGAEKSPAFMFLPPSVCLSGPGRVAFEGGQDAANCT
jgi:hypothetical protein